MEGQIIHRAHDATIVDRGITYAFIFLHNLITQGFRNPLFRSQALQKVAEKAVELAKLFSLEIGNDEIEQGFIIHK